jgi:hypothetical protein
MTSSLTRSKPAEKGLGWTSLAFGLISLVSMGAPLASALFPFLAIGTLLFVAGKGALTVAVLRSTATVSWIASSLDGAGRASGETDEV